MFTIKTKSKMLKAQFVVFMTRNRYVGSYPKLKRFVLVNFLFVVIGFIGWNITIQVPEISVKWESTPVVYEQRAKAQNIASDEVLKGDTSIEGKIRTAFGKDGDMAVKIAKCESNLEPWRVGDNHLTFIHNGEILGRSIGLFQIRTGGEEKGVWSRPAKAGVPVSAYEELLKNEDANIAVAYKIFKESGWTPWTCAGLVK